MATRLVIESLLGNVFPARFPLPPTDDTETDAQLLGLLAGERTIHVYFIHISDVRGRECQVYEVKDQQAREKPWAQGSGARLEKMRISAYRKRRRQSIVDTTPWAGQVLDC
jgi:hypothetical protein